MLTTTSITAVSVSTRSDQQTCRSPELIHGNSAIRVSWCMKPTSTSAIQDSAAETNSSPVVISSAAREPAAGGSETCMVVVAVIVMAMVVMGGRRMGVGAMTVVVMLDRIAARVARMRAEDRDQPGENGAQQRQKDDCLDMIRMISENGPLSGSC